MENYDHIYIIGDTHGEHHVIQRAILDRPKNSLFIHVGDVGIGFPSCSRIEALSLSCVDKALLDQDSKLYAIRGNHDDPEPFARGDSKNNIYLLPDYTEKEINGLRWRFVGGATSIDRYARREGISYWKDEVLTYQKCDTEVDVLIMHTSPTSCYPVDSDSRLKSVINRFVPPLLPLQNEMFEDLKRERVLAETIFKEASASQIFYGHFHSSNEEYKNGCYKRLLDINEIVEFSENPDK